MSDKFILNRDNLLRAQKAAQIGSWIYDIDKDEFEWSDEVYSILGLSRNSAPEYKIFLDAVHPDDREYVISSWNRIKNGEKYDIEFRVIANNKIKWIHENVIHDWDAAGRVISVLGTIQDITKQKLTELALKESEEKYRLLINNIPDVTWVTDNKGHTSFLSPNIKRIFGFTSKEIIKGGNVFWLNRIHKDDKEKFENAITKLMSEGTPFDTEYRIKKKNGDWIWLHDRALSHPQKEGEIHTYRVLSEITSRKIAEKDLRVSREKFSMILYSSPDSIIITEPDTGFLIDSNEGFTRTFGYTSDDILGKTTFDLGLWLDYEHRNKLIETLERDGKVSDHKGKLLSKSGSVLDVEIFMEFIEIGGKKYLLTLAKDVTEQKKVKEEYKESVDFLKSVFKSAPTGIGVAIDRVFQKVNERFCEIVGYMEDELIGNHSSMLDPPGGEFEIYGKDKYYQIIEKGALTVETKLKCKNGQIIDVLLSSTPMDTEDLSKGITFTALDITERISAEKRLHMVLEATTDAIWDWNIATGEVYFSPRWLTMLGYKPDEFPHSYRTWEMLLHPEEKDFTVSGVKKYLKPDMGPFSIEFRMKMKNGEYKWILGRGKAVEFDDDNKPLRMVGTHVDISERRNAEDALKESEERFRAMFDTITNGVAVYKAEDNGKDFVFLDFNKSAEMIENIKKEELIGKKVTEVFPSIKDFGLFKVFETVYKTGINGYLPIRQYKDDRISGWRENYVYKLPSGEIFAIYEDITKKKQAEDEIRKQNEFLNNLLESLSHPFYVINIDTYQVEMANNAANFGKLDENSTCHLLTHQSDTPCCGKDHPCTIELIKNSKKPVVVEHIHTDPDGFERSFEIHGFPIFDSKGNLVRMIEYSIDITDKKKLEKDLEFAQKISTVGDISRKVAHEVRNPLSSIRFAASNLNTYLELESDEQRLIDIVLQETDRLDGIVNEFLSFSRMKTPTLLKQRLEPIIEDFMFLVENNESYISKNIDLDVSVTEKLPELNLDKDLIKEVFLNLLLNAVDAVQERGKIRLFADSVKYMGEDNIRIIISDNGAGISEAMISRIFDPYVTSKANGTGLGLSIARKTISDHGGTITVKSILAEGTIFSIYLPLNFEKGNSYE